jgi:hypothetical protein
MNIKSYLQSILTRSYDKGFLTLVPVATIVGVLTIVGFIALLAIMLTVFGEGIIYLSLFLFFSFAVGLFVMMLVTDR